MNRGRGADGTGRGPKMGMQAGRKTIMLRPFPIGLAVGMKFPDRFFRQEEQRPWA